VHACTFVHTGWGPGLHPRRLPAAACQPHLPPGLVFHCLCAAIHCCWCVCVCVCVNVCMYSCVRAWLLLVNLISRLVLSSTAFAQQFIAAGTRVCVHVCKISCLCVHVIMCMCVCHEAFSIATLGTHTHTTHTHTRTNTRTHTHTTHTHTCTITTNTRHTHTHTSILQVG